MSPMRTMVANRLPRSRPRMPTATAVTMIDTTMNRANVRTAAAGSTCTTAKLPNSHASASSVG